MIFGLCYNLPLVKQAPIRNLRGTFKNLSRDQELNFRVISLLAITPSSKLYTNKIQSIFGGYNCLYKVANKNLNHVTFSAKYRQHIWHQQQNFINSDIETRYLAWEIRFLKLLFSRIKILIWPRQLYGQLIF